MSDFTHKAIELPRSIRIPVPVTRRGKLMMGAAVLCGIAVLAPWRWISESHATQAHLQSVERQAQAIVLVQEGSAWCARQQTSQWSGISSDELARTKASCARIEEARSRWNTATAAEFNKAVEDIFGRAE